MAAGDRTSVTEARAELAQRLLTLRPELEQAVTSRVYAISDPSEVADPAYVEGLLKSLPVALDYALGALEVGEDRAAPVPPELLTQARIAARNRVGLDTVLRRYFAGYGVVAEFAIAEVEDSGSLLAVGLRDLLRGQAALFDRLVAAISEEYVREAAVRRTSTEERRVERVERLLAGELIDVSGFTYPFDGFHLALVVEGNRAVEGLRQLAAALDQRLLLIERPHEEIWAWLGSRRMVAPAEVQRGAQSLLPRPAILALGEAGQGLEGWRRTHRQARVAFPIAKRTPGVPARYRDVSLLASVVKDPLQTTSLRETYLSPLAGGTDGGDGLLTTLRAYFAAGCNISATAAGVGVSRQTVTKRIRAAEERLGRSLTACTAELEIALRIDELERQPCPSRDQST